MSADLKLVIFDCDGTLLDSQHMIVGAMRMAFRDNGLAEPEAAAVREIIGLSLHEAVGRLAPRSLSPTRFESLVEGYKHAFIRQRQSADFFEPMFDGARDTVLALSGRDDVLLGVATGKSRRGVDVFLAREGLADRFHSIQTADDAPSKPHPGMIDNSIGLTGVDRARVLMVGDTIYDIEMARNAGVAAVGVGWGYHAPDRLAEAGAHRMIGDFAELIALVDALDAGRFAEDVR